MYCKNCLRNADLCDCGSFTAAAKPEPKPTGNGEIVLNEVIKDLLDRSKEGEKKYGTLLKTNNGRNALMDAYQEALDLCMYLKQCLMENSSMYVVESNDINITRIPTMQELDEAFNKTPGTIIKTKKPGVNQQGFKPGCV